MGSSPHEFSSLHSKGSAPHPARADTACPSHLGASNCPCAIPHASPALLFRVGIHFGGTSGLPSNHQFLFVAFFWVIGVFAVTGSAAPLTKLSHHFLLHQQSAKGYTKGRKRKTTAVRISDQLKDALSRMPEVILHTRAVGGAMLIFSFALRPLLWSV